MFTPDHHSQDRLGQLLRQAWRVAIWPETAMIVLALLLAATLVGGLLPQMAARAAAGSPAQTRWLEAHVHWGAWADRFAKVGLAQIYTGRVFRVLLALVAALAALWALRLWIPVWAALPRRAAARPLTLCGEAGQARAKLDIALRGAGLRIIHRAERDGVYYALAGRWGLGRWLPSLFFIGVILLLATAPLGERFGWAGPDLDLALGETQTLDHGANLTARLEQIELYPRDDGSLRRFTSQLSLSHQSQPTKTLTVSPGRRASYDGYSLYQTGYGPAARVSARDLQGRALILNDLTTAAPAGRVLRVRFDEQQQERLLRLADRDLIIRLVYYPALPAQGIANRALHAQLLRGRDGQLVAEQFLAADGALVAGDVRVEIGFEYYITLRAEREPELPLAGMGAALMLIGLAALTIWPPRTVWTAFAWGDEGASGQIMAARSEVDSGWFRRLAAQCSAEYTNEEAHG